MDDNQMRHFIDPRTSKILMDIVRSGSINVKRLCEANPGIPRSTMYRLLARLERDGLVDVVDYTRKRGTVEKTYAIHPGALPGTGDAPLESADCTRISEMFLSFCMQFASSFADYAERNPGEISRREVLGFWTAPVYGTDREVEHLVEEFGRIFSGFKTSDTEGERKFHTIGFVVGPPSADAKSEERRWDSSAA